MEIDNQVRMEIDGLSEDGANEYSKEFEDLFWKVFNNKFIRRYLFMTLQTMKTQGDSIKSFYIGNRQQFGRIKSLSWMVKRKAWALLKLKLKNSAEFPTEENYLDFYSGNSYEKIVPGSEKDEYLQITAKGVSGLFKECQDMEIFRLLYLKKRDQMNIVGDILKCAVENENFQAVKLFLEDEEFKGKLSTALALEWCIENEKLEIAEYLYNTDESVSVSTSKLFSSPRSNEMTKFVLDRPGLYAEAPKNSLISYKVFLETKDPQLQMVMVDKELVDTSSLALLDFQNRITLSKKEFVYNEAIVKYIKRFFRIEEVFSSKYIFFAQQLLFDVLKDLTSIKDVIEKAKSISSEQKIIKFICESASLIEQFKLNSNFADLCYFMSLTVETRQLDSLFSHYSLFKNSNFKVDEIKEIFQLLYDSYDPLNSFIQAITPIKGLSQDDAIALVESLPDICSNAYLILKSFYIDAAKRCDVQALIIIFQYSYFRNFNKVFEASGFGENIEMFTECDGDIDKISNFICCLCFSKVSYPFEQLTKHLRKVVTDRIKFIQVFSNFPKIPECNNVIRDYAYSYLRNPGNENTETISSLLKYSADYLSPLDAYDLFSTYIEEGEIEMANALFDSFPGSHFQTYKVENCEPQIIKWFMEKYQNGSNFDFSELLDTLIEVKSPFETIEMVFNFLVSYQIYQLPPKKLEGIKGNFFSYKAVKLSLEYDSEQVFNLLFSNHQLFFWNKSLFSIEIDDHTFSEINNRVVLFRNSTVTKKKKKTKFSPKKNSKAIIISGNNNNNNSETPLNVQASAIVEPKIKTDKYKYVFNSKFYQEELGLLVSFGEVSDAIQYLKSQLYPTPFPKERVFKIIKYSSMDLVLEYFSITKYEQLSDEEIVGKMFKYGRNDIIEVLFKTHYNQLERSFKKCAQYNNFHTVVLLLKLVQNKHNSNKSAFIINLSHQLIKEAIISDDIIIFNLLYFNFTFKLSLDCFIQDYSQSNAFNENYKTVKELSPSV
ncbi:hypothetical protein DICPUDRAFT_81149 [Dictyostelium purpureum]|uniref:Uncharacterized protein n=1 Tax=Dictyostelium purpureum TaxID=5786 RepID=F0ZSM7_DICPU|nr:uncharacterized protein DICPUDRAFT_81149 [Dictyostelium purpureum]EGC33063.1 hypothetical protein DICPUDRAFT_81149 [Dictyostelium purpureum]|eukprot:XP_003290413.1 hypothetical protein DICPUDRAFT_81149 [Dictyostelium purpureum]